MIRISPEQISQQDDWRPSIYLTGGAFLRIQGESWPCLDDLGVGVRIYDGWRVSRNPLAEGYDPMVETAPIFRLKNISPYWIDAEADHWLSPRIENESYCVQPNDIVMKKVGGAQAAIVSNSHGRHPVDANLAIIRGLLPEEAVWVCYCINQTLYQEYLNETHAISSMPRLSLKKLKQMPICQMPGTFKDLAKLFVATYDRYAEAQNALFILRREIDQWIAELLDDFDWDAWQEPSKCHWLFLPPEHIDDSLQIYQAEQNALSHQLIEKYSVYALKDIAKVKSASSGKNDKKEGRALLIGAVSESLTIKDPLPDVSEAKWRLQHDAIDQYDVVMSTFSDNSKVAYVVDQPEEKIYPTEQIVVFQFNSYPGAYALLMESRLVRLQLKRMGASGGFRFVNAKQLGKIVLPEPDTNMAKVWHQKVVKFTRSINHAEATLKTVLKKMQNIYNSVHQNIRNPGNKEAFNG